MPVSKSNILAIAGYTIALVLLGLSGGAIYDFWKGIFPEEFVLAFRLYQSFFFGTVFLVVAGARRLRLLKSVSILLHTSTICFLAGFLFFSLSIALHGKIFAVAAATLFPVGRSLCLIFFIFYIAQLKRDEISKAILTAWTVSAPLLVLFIGAIRNQLLYLIVFFAFVLSIMPIGSLLIKNFGSNGAETSPDKLAENSDQTLPGQNSAESLDARDKNTASLKDTLLVLLFASLFNLFSSLIYSLMNSSGSVIDFNSGVIQSICKLIVAAVLLLVWKKILNVPFINKSFQILYAIVLLSGLLLVFHQSELYVPLGILTGMASAATTILLILIAVLESKDRNLDIVIVYSLFSGIFYLFMSLGTLLGLVSYSLSSSNYDVYMWVSIGSIYLLSMVFFIYSRIYSSQVERRLVAQQAVLAEQTTDKVAARCERLAEEFGLSPRESEVLLWIAQGRDAAYVSAKLFVSENTVRTHIKNMYRKMGIHNRQELFTIVNESDKRKLPQA